MVSKTRRPDIVVIGAGFGGCLAAMVARQLGRSVLLIERGAHPRFVIGESTTPLTNFFLEEIGNQYELAFLKGLSSWGRWQQRFPHLPCGLKRGFSFFHHQQGECFNRGGGRARELLVAASPGPELADTHWFRPSFDAFLLEQAVGLGVEYQDRTTVVAAEETPSGMCLDLQSADGTRRLEASLVIDASGPRGALYRLLGLKNTGFSEMPSTRAVYSHFRSVAPCVSRPEFCSHETPPYPIDAAAVHHLLDQGWMWVLRFNHGITSAGVVFSRENKDPELDGEALWHSVLDRYPSLGGLFAGGEPVEDFCRMDQVPFCVGEAGGKHWVLLPAAAAAIDPLFSTGFPLNLLGILRLGRLIRAAWAGESMEDLIRRYSHEVLSEAVRTSRLVGLAYRSIGRPRLFNAITYLYFAAVSYEETYRRLGLSDVADRFLLGSHSEFGARLDDMVDRLSGRIRALPESEIGRLEGQILRAVQPFDVMGLGRRHRHNWYPVDLVELFAARDKFPASADQLIQLLSQMGVNSQVLERFR